MTWGDADYLKKQSQILESISAEIADIYAERANGSAEEVRELMKEETWMKATQAEEAGFVAVVNKDGKDKAKEEDASSKLKSEQLITNKKLMFKSDKDLQAKFEASQAEVTEHEATIVKREAEVVTLSEDLSVANTKLGEQESSIKDLTDKLETSNASVTTITAELDESKGKQKDFDSKVSKQAAAKVAELGHPEAVAAADEDVKLSLYEQFKELKATNPDQAGAFWRKNEEAIKASA